MNDRFEPLRSTAAIQIQAVAAEISLVLSTALVAHIEKGWQQLLGKRTITENATLLRVVDHKEGMVSVVPDITYKEVVGYRHAPTTGTCPFQVLSVMAIVVTADGYIVLQERDSGDWPMSYENVGWFVRSHQVGDTLDNIIATKIKEELPVDDFRLLPLGIYEARSIAECMYVYQAELSAVKDDFKMNDRLCFVKKEDLPKMDNVHTPTKRVLEYVYVK